LKIKLIFKKTKLKPKNELSFFLFPTSLLALFLLDFRSFEMMNLAAGMAWGDRGRMTDHRCKSLSIEQILKRFLLFDTALHRTVNRNLITLLYWENEGLSFEFAMLISLM